ncbi:MULTISPECIES: hypothetical protein [Cyanophyceae]|uniref:hypothetical protein n=1 Tax=Cyanophyceae TaxID=3028117 RepID=UPI0011813559|nr:MULTISPECIES: hypothetical protein [Cyanophyceae]
MSLPLIQKAAKKMWRSRWRLDVTRSRFGGVTTPSVYLEKTLPFNSLAIFPLAIAANLKKISRYIPEP